MNEWEETDDVLHKRFELEDFEAALSFVNDIAEVAEEYGHHPDILFGWGYAEISLTTHEEGKVTDIDHTMADAIDETFKTQAR